MQAGKSADGEIQGQRGKENFQRFRKNRGGIVSEKRTERREHESGFGGAIGEQAARHIRNQQTCPQVEQDLCQQDGAEIAPSKDRKKRGKKCRISGQARERGDNLARIGDAVDAVLQPVHGNIGVEARIVDDSGKVEQKSEPQSESGQDRRQEESNILTR